MIVIVDYAMGNVGSIRNMLKKLGAQSCLGTTAEQIQNADKLILPGVGAFDTGMRHLAERELLDALNHAVLERRVPLLGICLGMQLLTRGSEEGQLPGLDWIRGDTVRFHFDQAATGLKIPHMGWNAVAPRQTDTLFNGLEEEARFYFVHSYHVVCENETDILAESHHGYDFTCAVQSGNIMGTQFHPEKSHRFGMQLLKNFVSS